MTVVKSSFAPVVDDRTRLLLLGSLPGDRSLAEQRYYAHPQNQFWRLVGAALELDLPAMAYPDRLDALLSRGIGLWDVVARARREGSGDAAIRDPAANDLAALVERLPALRALAFNGATALALGRRSLSDRFPALRRIALPSSSPLHTIGFAAKLPAWLALRDLL